MGLDYTQANNVMKAFERLVGIADRLVTHLENKTAVSSPTPAGAVRVETPVASISNGHWFLAGPDRGAGRTGETPVETVLRALHTEGVNTKDVIRSTARPEGPLSPEQVSILAAAQQAFTKNDEAPPSITVHTRTGGQHCSGCNRIGTVRVGFSPPGGDSYFSLCPRCAQYLGTMLRENTRSIR